VRVKFRATASPTSAPVGVAKTGEQVASSSGAASGRCIQLGDAIRLAASSFSDSKPPPLEHVAQLEAQVADLQASSTPQCAKRARIASASNDSPPPMPNGAERCAGSARKPRPRAGERWP